MQAFEEKENRVRESYPLHDLGDMFFEMTTIEDANEYYFKDAHRHDFYELLWFTGVTDEQLHYIDFNKCLIQNNQIFLLLPGQVHHLDQQGKQGYLMAMSKDFFERIVGSDMAWFVSYSCNFNLVLSHDLLPVLNTLTDLIKREYQAERRAVIIESYLRSWFLHCIEAQRQLNPKPYSDLRMQTLIELIELQYRKQRSADFYARQLSVSAKRLNELTRESYGKTISQLINDRLILEAKRAIGCIDKPIKEISYELGFSEPSYFTRFFGKQTGLAPQDFRKRIAAFDH